MRQVIFGVANSLDNFIAGPDHGVDWLLMSRDVQKIMGEFWPRVDTVIMGRKTYEVSLAFGGGGGSPAIKTYIVSRTLDPAAHPAVEIVASNPGELVRELKQQPGKEICVMGGGELARHLLDAGMVDEIGLNIHPILLGGGVPLFHSLRRPVHLELVECRTLEHGCVYVTYRVKARHCANEGYPPVAGGPEPLVAPGCRPG